MKAFGFSAILWSRYRKTGDKLESLSANPMRLNKKKKASNDAQIGVFSNFYCCAFYNKVSVDLLKSTQTLTLYELL